MIRSFCFLIFKKKFYLYVIIFFVYIYDMWDFFFIFEILSYVVLICCEVRLKLILWKCILKLIFKGVVGIWLKVVYKKKKIIFVVECWCVGGWVDVGGVVDILGGLWFFIIILNNLG